MRITIEIETVEEFQALAGPVEEQLKKRKGLDFFDYVDQKMSANREEPKGTFFDFKAGESPELVKTEPVDPPKPQASKRMAPTTRPPRAEAFDPREQAGADARALEAHEKRMEERKASEAPEVPFRVITLDDIKRALKSLPGARDKAKAALSKFGKQTISELKESELAAFAVELGLVDGCSDEGGEV